MANHCAVCLLAFGSRERFLIQDCYVVHQRCATGKPYRLAELEGQVADLQRAARDQEHARATERYTTGLTESNLRRAERERDAHAATARTLEGEVARQATLIGTLQTALQGSGVTPERKEISTEEDATAKRFSLLELD